MQSRGRSDFLQLLIGEDRLTVSWESLLQIMTSISKENIDIGEFCKANIFVVIIQCHSSSTIFKVIYSSRTGLSFSSHHQRLRVFVVSTTAQKRTDTGMKRLMVSYLLTASQDAKQSTKAKCIMGDRYFTRKVTGNMKGKTSLVFFSEHNKVTGMFCKMMGKTIKWFGFFFFYLCKFQFQIS